MQNNYPTFDEVDNLELKAWNRASMFFNIMADESVDKAKAYISQFSEQERSDVNEIFARVKVNGYNSTRRDVLANNTFLGHSDPSFDERENQVVH